jgi:RimJ/RimL family protein N-acetyltransferase
LLFPHLQSIRVRLSPARFDDGVRAYEIMLRAGMGTMPTLDAFLETFGKGGKAQFIAEMRETGEAIGHVVLRDRNTAGHIHVDIHLDVGAADTGVGAEIAMLALNYAFAMWDLRKAYLEATSKGLSALGLSDEQRKLLTEEAILRDHVYQQGRLWDQHILSVDRETWEREGAEPAGLSR